MWSSSTVDVDGDMVMAGFSDDTMRTVAAALDGLAARATVRAHNIANAETPGYKATTVDFESQLARHLAGGGRRTDLTATSLRPGLVDETGNSVDLETEMTELVADNLMFQAMVNSANYRAAVTRTAMSRPS